MKRRVSVIFLIIFFAVSLEASSLSRIINKLQKIYEKAEDFKSEFHQESYNRTFKRWVKADGVVYMKKSGKMRWEYKGENAQTIVSDGKTMWVYQSAAKEVIISDLRSSVAKVPVSFLDGMGNLKRDFKVEKISLKDYPSSKYIVLRLTPKKELPNLTEMILVIKRKDFSVKEVRSFDFYHNENRIIFKNPEINSGLKDSLFRFKIPPGTRVMKMPSR